MRPAFPLCKICLLLHYVQLLAKLDSKAATFQKNSPSTKKLQFLGDYSMKKSLLALAALGTFAGVAHAQSSVTLYGIVDAGFVFNNNAGGNQLYNLNSGNLQGSRWGLRGTEDLGGGLKAIFVLENGFNVMTRASWAKAATVRPSGVSSVCRRTSSVRSRWVASTTPLLTTSARWKSVANGAGTSRLTRATSTT